MSDYTPSTDTARECFVDGAAGEFIGEDFDRWLESVRAEERERIARNIEAEAPSPGSAYANAGVAYERGGMLRAARIAREGA